MAKLGENWRDLEPDFQAARLIEQTIDLLPPGHVALQSMRTARARLHPAVWDPSAIEEFEARMRGTYAEPETTRRAPRQDAAPQPGLAEVLAQLAAMQRQLEQLQGPRPEEPKPEPKPEGEPQAGG